MTAASGSLRRVARQVSQRARTLAFQRSLEVVPRSDVEEVGDLGYGGYMLPVSLLTADSVCYFAGVGEDASFDLDVIGRFGCTVHAFDPVPRAADYAARVSASEPRFVFHPYALWSRDEKLTFHAPRERGYVSQSATNLHGTNPDFEAQARSLDSLMRELGHDRVDVLKISAEGSEYEIVDDLLARQAPVRVLCAELTQPAPRGRPAEAVKRLAAAGYQLVGASLRPWGWKLTWVGP